MLQLRLIVAEFIDFLSQDTVYSLNFSCVILSARYQWKSKPVVTYMYSILRGTCTIRQDGCYTHTQSPNGTFYFPKIKLCQ